MYAINANQHFLQQNPYLNTQPLNDSVQRCHYTQMTVEHSSYIVGGRRRFISNGKVFLNIELINLRIKSQNSPTC